MLHSARLLKRPKSFRALSGLSPAEFAKLLPEVAVAWQAAADRRAASQTRKRRVGGGPKHKMELADRLLLVWVYYRTCVTQEFLGVLSGVDASTANRILKALHPVLAPVFRIPEKRIALAEDEIREVFFDGTEPAAYRPEAKQRRRYSGEKKRHTFEHPVAVARVAKAPFVAGQKRRARVKAVSPAFPGKVHDKKIYARCRMRRPAGVAATGDSGCQGTALRTPHKTPRGGALTPEQKAGNRRLSKRRIAVEHGIGKMKIWRSCEMRFRNHPKRKTVMFENVAGLHNRMFG